MTFDKLSNEEIAFIYLLADDMLEAFNEVVERNGVSYIVDSPLGKAEIFREFTPEEMETIKTSLKVELLTSITEKLSPVIDLIGETNQECIEKVRKALFPMDGEDGAEEEDM